MNTLLRTTLFLLLLCGASPAWSEDLVEQFAGSESAVTGEFEVNAPWIIDWLVTSDYRSGISIEVWLIDASDGSNLGYVVNTTGTGNGVKLFDESGRYYLRVNSALVNWNLKVSQLTPEEARSYTPRD